eukprot:COSAG02_NODE_3051_length_7468_cov_2.280092_3_plen_41_part_00
MQLNFESDALSQWGVAATRCNQTVKATKTTYVSTILAVED